MNGSFIHHQLKAQNGGPETWEQLELILQCLHKQLLMEKITVLIASWSKLEISNPTDP